MANRRPFSLGGYLLAALVSPGISVLIFYALSLSIAAVRGAPFRSFNGLENISLFLYLATMFGLGPTLVFGGAGVAVLHRIEQRRPLDRLGRILGGTLTATAYVVVSWALSFPASDIVSLGAPWLAVLTPKPGYAVEWPAVVLVTGSIIASGGAAGWIYDLLQRRGRNLKASPLSWRLRCSRRVRSKEG